MPKATLKEQLAACREANTKLCNDLYMAEQARGAANQRVKEIAAENESLRMDKRWLQSIISPLAQAIHTRS
jgi:hypothetical protein